MDIAGNKIDLKPIPKFDKMERIQARKSWIISQETIQNTYTVGKNTHDFSHEMNCRHNS